MKTKHPEKILVAPHITEKSTELTEKNKYVFKVHPQANKIDIKKAVEKFYNVGVTKVNTTKIPPKIKMRQGKPGKKPGYKKAIVTLQEGDKIDLFA